MDKKDKKPIKSKWTTLDSSFRDDDEIVATSGGPVFTRDMFLEILEEVSRPRDSRPADLSESKKNGTSG